MYPTAAEAARADIHSQQIARMRDFFDIHALAENESFDGEVLSRSLQATFARRRTEIPAEAPVALTPHFAEVEGKGAPWSGFVRRNRLEAAPVELGSIVDGIAALVGPVLAALGRGQPFVARWRPGGPWE